MTSCDRCKQLIENFTPPSPEHMTAGYYKDWALFMDEGEHIVCDRCAWNDPRYIAVYGRIKVE